MYAAGRNRDGQLTFNTTVIRLTYPTLVESLMGLGVIGVSCGGFHSHAVTKNNEVYAFGTNFRGQLGVGDKISRTSPTKVVGLAGKNIIKVRSGYAFGMALSSSGKAYSWGSNFVRFN